MLFNSAQFMIFFPVVTALYFLLPHRYRWALLLVASCVFYMAFIPVYIFILVVVIVVDYIAGICIEGSTGGRRRLFLIVSIISNVGFLAFFKYFNFLNENIAYLARLVHWNYPINALYIILPIGLSFHTFQAMSYTIEVYRANQKAERHFGIYALYVMFYPQLVAGPIERPMHLIHQFYEEHRFDYARVTDGLKLMAWGLFKKVVIADRLAVLVNPVYDYPAAYPGMSLLFATVFFAYQIYCDFSGYSDIAIGAAQVMGFDLMNNFNRPYFSKSITEFWKRWHISLSTWFRDYVYIPMGGNRAGRARWQYNLLITFLLSGLWHGANWTYVAWGALHGFYRISSIWTNKARLKLTAFTRLDRLPVLHKCLRVITTFSLVSFAWIFFRAASVPDALYIVTKIASGVIRVLTLHAAPGLLTAPGLCDRRLLIPVIAILFMESAHLAQRHGSVRLILSGKPAIVRWAVYYALVFGIIIFGMFDSTPFIYFQF